jgi:Flp pilus assembly protein TadG
MYRDESGQVMVLTVLCMTCLIGFLALAIDVGLVFRAKRNLQIAADAAATAAALDYFYNKGSNTAVATAKTVGTTAAGANGYSTATGATVTINSGNLAEITTPWHNSAGFFEAVLTTPTPTAFMGYFGFSSMTVNARAVAGTPGSNTINCIYVLDSTGTLGPGQSGSGDSTVWLQGSFQVNAPKCGIQINGTAADTLYYNGNGGSTSAKFIGVVGGAGGHYSTYTPQPKQVTAVSDPMSSFSFPTPTGCTTPAGGALTGSIGTAGATTCYQGNVSVTNATFYGTVIFTGGDVTFGGTVNSDPVVGTGASATGGTTLVFQTGAFNENPGTVFNLSGQPNGPLPGVVLAAPSTNTSTMTLQFGNSTGTFTGIVYMPAATFYFQDSGGDHSGGLTFNIDLIVGQLDDKTTTLNINGYTPPGSIDPLDKVVLVE